MKVNAFAFENWRNLKDDTLYPCDGVNVLFGDNAQGKTNLLEGLWSCSGAKSFRGAKENELVAFGKEYARLTLSFFSEGRDQQLELRFGAQKKILLNGVEQKSATDLYRTVSQIIFAPNHLALIKEGPAGRRQFLDFALARLKPSFHGLEARYERALEQRNALLRDYRRFTGGEELMTLWEDGLANLGSVYARQRQIYVEKIAPFARRFYHELSGEKETLELAYEGAEYSSDAGGYEKLLTELAASRESDARVGYTTVGPHRHDLTVNINGRSARAYGSQGQQRSAALALKLAEAEVMADYVGETPMILLDDVMSELDSNRQDYILNKFSGRQVFITCCDPMQVLRLTKGKSFAIREGEIHETQLS